ncbi:hypothetical protein NQ317_013576 [Molorchus minor]|uniref:Uncharacterized protein n=1 Tax=Molorchus minor TaxID=1323400 RepID=A0ABQ9J218_9CUCU|nr:hypothetical protein NQ317_013576 [Molorchus minor]
MSSSSGPDVTLFKRFKEYWPKIGQTNFKTGFQLETIKQSLQHRKSKIVDFINSFLAIQHPRDDYEEFNSRQTRHNIVLVHFITHAGCLKPFIVKKKFFQDQFKLTQKQQSAMNDICLFLEYHIYINEFNGPHNIENLTISNCTTLTVFFRCTAHRTEKKYLKHLEISDIETLKFQNVINFQSQLPTEVVIRNVKLIADIPGLTFIQFNRRLNRGRCNLPIAFFQSLLFSNVTVDTIRPFAFLMPKLFGNANFLDVRINTILSSGLKVNHRQFGSFKMLRSSVETLQPSALEIFGNDVIFSENKFGNISLSGIKVTAETFSFCNNSVSVLQPYALSVFAVNTSILNNRFEDLKAWAFMKIGPGLIMKPVGDSGSFIYDFSGNCIKSTQENCLQPDVEAFRGVSTWMSFKMNELPCSCSKSDWLIQSSSRNILPSSIKWFYDMVFDVEAGNICSSPCKLPLVDTKSYLDPTKCLEDNFINELCFERDQKYQSTESTTDISEPMQTINDTSYDVLSTLRQSTVSPNAVTATTLKYINSRISNSGTTEDTNNLTEQPNRLYSNQDNISYGAFQATTVYQDFIDDVESKPLNNTLLFKDTSVPPTSSPIIPIMYTHSMTVMPTLSLNTSDKYEDSFTYALNGVQNNFKCTRIGFLYALLSLSVKNKAKISSEALKK